MPDAAPAPEVSARALVAAYSQWIETIPVGTHDAQRGESAYNWHRASLAQLHLLHRRLELAAHG
jgi:hypothetical protein